MCWIEWNSADACIRKERGFLEKKLDEMDWIREGMCHNKFVSLRRAVGTFVVVILEYKLVKCEIKETCVNTVINDYEFVVCEQGVCCYHPSLLFLLYLQKTYIFLKSKQAKKHDEYES